MKNAAGAGAEFVCLFGDASYDFKDILRVRPARRAGVAPAHIRNGYQSRQFMTDDWLVDLDLGVTNPTGASSRNCPTRSTTTCRTSSSGRLPVSNAAEAAFVVDQKIIPYDNEPTWGEWRHRVLLLADDTVQGAEARPAVGDTHRSTARPSRRGYLPDVVEQRKIYMVRYPFGAGTEKPTVNRDVKATVNEGVLLWNYIGHGNPFKMADENAFILSDVSSLVNLDKPTFLVAASCDLGKFDDPSTTGLGESLLNPTAGGAIAAFSASDLAFAFANAALNPGAVPSTSSRSSPRDYAHAGIGRPGGEDALYSSVNDLKYTLMGDPGSAWPCPAAGAPGDHRRRDRRAARQPAARPPRARARRGARLTRPERERPARHVQRSRGPLVTDSPPRDTLRT